MPVIQKTGRAQVLVEAVPVPAPIISISEEIEIDDGHIEIVMDDTVILLEIEVVNLDE